MYDRFAAQGFKLFLHANLGEMQAKTGQAVPEGFDIRKAAAIPVAFGTADDIAGLE